MIAQDSLSRQIKTVLQAPPFGFKIKKIKKIKTGGSSENYICICPSQKYFIKILSKNAKLHAQRLNKILEILHQNPPFFETAPYFELKNNIGLIQTYISRKEFKAKDLTRSKIDLIANAYKAFQEKAQNLNELAQEEIDLDVFFQNNIQTLESLNSSAFQNCFFINKIKKIQEEIYKTPPQKLQKPKQVIHGDLQRHNMLYNIKARSVTLIDFEGIRFGYPIEDITKLVLSAFLKHHFLFLPQKPLEKAILAFNQNFNFSKEEWLYGLKVYYFQSIKQRLRQQKFLRSWRKKCIYLFRLGLFKKICALLDKIYQNTP